MADMKTAYHIVNGPANMYAADANYAVRAHPGEWSNEPWSIEETNAFRKREYDRQVAEARRLGQPEPEPPVELTVSGAQQQELDADAKAREDAANLIREDDEKRAQEADYQRRVNEARALLASAPPQPTPVPANAADQNPRAQVEIADDWKDWSGPKKRSLAMRLGAPNTVTVPEAEERIESETKRRKEQGPAQGATAAQSADRGNPSGSAPNAPNDPGPNDPTYRGPAPAPVADPYAHQPGSRPSPDVQPQPQPSATFENPSPKPGDPAPKVK